jgi:hypothetical protein
MGKSAAERKAKQRARAKAKGLCAICCKRKARAGLTTCKPCYERTKAWLYEQRGSE